MPVPARTRSPDPLFQNIPVFYLLTQIISYLCIHVPIRSRPTRPLHQINNHIFLRVFKSPTVCTPYSCPRFRVKNPLARHHGSSFCIPPANRNPNMAEKTKCHLRSAETRNSYWSCVPQIFTLTNSPRLLPQLTKRFEEIISCATRDLNSIMSGHFVLGQPIFWIGFMDYYIIREDSSKLAFTHIAVPTKGTGMQLS
jgi:hypothetical protein